MKIKFSSYFSKQARKPTGLFGRFYMSQIFKKGNLELNAFTKEILSITPNDNILEIGCGTGILLKEIADELKDGFIIGCDFSLPMVSIAKKNNEKHINNNKVVITIGNFEELAFDENYFDKIFSVNTIYFWKNPEATISKILKLLKPNGYLVLGFHDKYEMEKMNLDMDIFQLYSSQDIIKLLEKHDSISEVTVFSKNGVQKINYCAIGVK
ncbi:class I SAM-dependent methyltransferase [Labilibaculum euxinus]|uniref:Methyltransferase domain-containing protein n=1 Tax=Labilibaculum euxinus TaxID=2686357 RepID=A0A7M4DAM3_9BACT|nr:class I SAM-dependent methyltransferase [Labilibaculum euxinus]MUP39702.1 methyltransferase domain-containing protein [Labilibaculum euxinus]MVB08907.1 methyltransferase domain-containing protein [Labilibaculum euxinus]